MTAYKHSDMFDLCRVLHNAQCIKVSGAEFFSMLVNKYSDTTWKNDPDFLWSDGNGLLTPVKWIADMIAEFLEDLDDSINVLTGYYEPGEDERDECVDNHTGNWYINIE